MRTITKDHAEIIASKLKCVKREASAHTVAEVFEDGILVARFGIRRGSRELGHGHLPQELHLRKQECARLYECTMDRPKYISLMRERGELQPAPPTSADSGERTPD